MQQGIQTQSAPSQPGQSFEKKAFSNQEKPKDVRKGNIIAAKALADMIRTSLGPKGMDKMIRDSKGEVTITNDGATILKQLQVVHPTAKMLVEISKAQDIEAGDGTTSVVIIAGALLNAAQTLLERGIHPTVVTEGFQFCLDNAERIIENIAKKIDLTDEDSLIQNCITSLSSKVVSQYSQILAPIAVKSVLKLVNNGAMVNNEVDLKDIKVSKLVGGTIEDTEMVDGLVFTHNKVSHSAGGPSRLENPKIALIQFCVSSPKTDMENTVVVNEYTAMDRILKEERKYIIDIVKKIKASGCNLLLIQKSILRDATNDLSLHFLAKAGIMVIKDIDREEVEFISKTVGAIPVAHVDHLTNDKLGKATMAEEITMSDGAKIVKITGILAII
jgi:T-complex protein 1 subunit delta